MFDPVRDFNDNHQIANTIVQHHDPFDCIVAVGRSGIPLAITIHEYFNPKIPIIYANVSSYEGEKSKSIKSVGLWDNELFHKFDGKYNTSVLIVDNIIDSGKTINYITNLIEVSISKPEIQIACKYFNNNAKLNDNIIPGKNLHCLRFKDDNDWIIQPHEKEAISGH